MYKKIILAFLLLVSLNLSASPLKKGDLLPLMKLNNQHGKLVTVRKDIKTLLFSVEKAPSKMINNFLKDKDAKYLMSHNTYFIADISGMPFLISKMFAIPKIKKYAYDVLLVRQKKLINFMPYKKEFVTVLKINSGKVASISFVNTEKQLADLIQ